MYRTRSIQKGFTLVEILIVVIILGILAAIVIPQFTNASEDARKSSLTSQLQTMRSQVELYKLQHRDVFPGLVGTTFTEADFWDKLVGRTNESGSTTIADGETAFGPYLQAKSQNPLTGSSVVVTADDDATALALTGQGANGWVISLETGKIWAFAKDGTIYKEGRVVEEGSED